ncbi:xanthine dehydrogenase YagR molybdenum-binding subunit [Nocardia tenerifensis]|uniref:Xanthine dehydrogenase YagR molybdenum-binding subunit n=1 Tax=Nocardia tenerifensis TaxID=228006 RepID=A0A318K337_9NOCA|nr:xanthine dehydrogenase family protein molybdopterin-binding subunit [Nocardia tenerifensis]PXX56333.1 xanthine dehydrogenase YagR molybdenum-binding subunit [Nocardia tenerifensis]
MTLIDANAMGASPLRLDGPAKVTGAAPYAFEHPVDRPTYLHPIQATIARGRVAAMDTAATERLDGVLAVLTVFDAPELADTSDGELSILQDDEVHFRGQLIGAVIAETAETARHGADLVRVDYRRQPADVRFDGDRDDLYAPDEVASSFPTDTETGDLDAGLAAAAITVDQTYTTPIEHNNPMEPHACIALWHAEPEPDGTVVTLYDSTQGVHTVRKTLAPLFGLEPDQIRVISPHVGGGFGAKGAPHCHNVLAVLAAQRSGGRPVKLALTRQQMFALVGYRTPTIQRIRLGADADGRLTALAHDVIEQTAKVKEYAEQSAVPSRVMYRAPNRRTSHRLAALDVPVPFWMRAPGEAPGMFAAEVAMDELAIACGLDPIELRIRNEPPTDPDSGNPWSGRHLIDCLRRGADEFGWDTRDPEPRSLRDGDWLVGTGVAAATYPAQQSPGNAARIEFDDRYLVEIGAADIGTGTWTALTQIAADALGCPTDMVDLRIGDSALPSASVAGGSSGITSWGTAIVAAAKAFRDKYGVDPAAGSALRVEAPDNPDADKFAMHSFGAQFVEVRVNRDTGEIRVPRMLGMFSIGRAINPRMLRAQLVGGMTWGLSMALHEESVRDPRFGHVVTQDLASYHVSVHADIGDIQAHWLDEVDEHTNPMGSRGAGEIGIVGAAAAVANAVHHATGLRVRDLPITADRLLS